jgi:hypothetical protein
MHFFELYFAATLPGHCGVADAIFVACDQPNVAQRRGRKWLLGPQMSLRAQNFLLCRTLAHVLTL